MTEDSTARSYGFDAEVRQLLDLVIHSLYSDKDVFLRELISNASDALDRARVLGLSRDDLRAGDGEPGITITVSPGEGTITIGDNGVGLTEAQAIEHLGTIARSGTKAFAEALKEKGEGNNLIGQFGVGFYSALMVADRVQVHTLSAEPDAEAVLWSCDGSTEYTVAPGTRTTRGTDVVLHVRADDLDFMSADRIKDIIQHHSEFVAWPIFLSAPAPEPEPSEDGEEAEEVEPSGPEQINTPKVIWTRNPKEVTEDEYKEFYKHLTKDWGEPATWLHVRAEAPLQYKSILYVPTNKPHDLNHADGQRHLKLYAKRVLIDEDARELLPDYLRFVRGVADSEDIQLNVSREMVQKTPVVEKIRKQLTSRVLKHLQGWAKKDPEDYLGFWRDFGPTLKEGLHNDSDSRKRLLELARFNSTRHNDDKGLVSFKEYVGEMAEGQDAIWYLTGPDHATLARSPHLEAFRRKGWEVLLLTDPVDEWVVQSIHAYDDKPLKSASRGAPELEDESPDAVELNDEFTSWMEGVFQGKVKAVRASKGRLTSSAAALVDDPYGLSSNMQRILAQMNQSMPGMPRALELNTGHPMVKAVAQLHADGKAETAEPLAQLLLDQALLVEGTVPDPGALVDRLKVLGELAARGLGVELPEADVVVDTPAESAPAETAEQAAPEADAGDADAGDADASAEQATPEGAEEVEAEFIG